MNDEALGQFLRDEVPAPKADYWETIEASLGLTATATDEESSSVRETADNLVRLTPMNFNPTLTRRRMEATWIALVAAAVVIIGGFTYVLTSGRGDSISSTAGEGAAQTVPPPDESPLGGEESDDADESGEATDDFEPQVGGTENSIRWQVASDGPVDLQRRPGFGGERILALPDGLQVDGTGRTEDADGDEWIEVSDRETGETGWVPRQVLELASLGSGAEQGSAVVETVVVQEGEPAVWDVDFEFGMNHRQGPGSTGEIIGYWVGDETDLVGTGRTATVNGDAWVELEAFGRNETGWVIREFLRPAGSDPTDGSANAGSSADSAGIVEGDSLLWDVAADFGVELRYEPSFSSGVFAQAEPGLTRIWGSGRSAVVDGEEWVELNLFHEASWAPVSMLEVVGSAPGHAPVDPPPGWVALEDTEAYSWRVVSSFGVNLRLDPSEASAAVGSLADGDVFDSLGLMAVVDGEEWIYVYGDGDDGAWVARDFVEPTP